MKTNKKTSYNNMINEVSTFEQLEYLTFVCYSRSKYTVSKVKKYLREGNFAKALQIGDPIAYNLGISEY